MHGPGLQAEQHEDVLGPAHAALADGGDGLHRSHLLRAKTLALDVIQGVTAGLLLRPQQVAELLRTQAARMEVIEHAILRLLNESEVVMRNNSRIDRARVEPVLAYPEVAPFLSFFRSVIQRQNVSCLKSLRCVLSRKEPQFGFPLGSLFVQKKNLLFDTQSPFSVSAFSLAQKIAVCSRRLISHSTAASSCEAIHTQR